MAGPSYTTASYTGVTPDFISYTTAVPPIPPAGGGGLRTLDRRTLDSGPRG
jgi:hypothetical protein